MKIVEELNKLTEQEIHDLLVKGGHKGFRFESDQCPIARYIKHETKCYYVDVLKDTIGINAYNYVVSPPLGEFIQHFDDGNYPELEQ